MKPIEELKELVRENSVKFLDTKYKELYEEGLIKKEKIVNLLMDRFEGSYRERMLRYKKQNEDFDPEFYQRSLSEFEEAKKNIEIDDSQVGKFIEIVKDYIRNAINVTPDKFCVATGLPYKLIEALEHRGMKEEEEENGS